MAQQVLGGTAENLGLEGCDVGEAKSTFDRLLRAYFARLVGEFPALSDVSHEPPPGRRNRHSPSNEPHVARDGVA
ncbi:hypothetical protein JOE50_005380 [Bradyrhizobium japonicum]|nr:hypothetical protein [Bradyrhizobium japonicum]